MAITSFVHTARQNIQQMHRDHVPTVPPTFQLLGSTQVSHNQGMLRYLSDSMPTPHSGPSDSPHRPHRRTTSATLPTPAPLRLPSPVPLLQPTADANPAPETAPIPLPTPLRLHVADPFAASTSRLPPPRSGPSSGATGEPLPPLRAVQILTLQGHPEYTKRISSAIVDARAASGVLDAETAAGARARESLRNDGVDVVGRAIWKLFGFGDDA